MLLPVVAGALCALCACVVEDRNVRPEEAAFRFSSFNVRGIMSEDVGSVFWTNRVPLIARTIVSHGMDVVCVQECRRKMALALAAALPDYACAGPAVKSGKNHEGNLVFYRKDRFACESEEVFWLSETPDSPFTKLADAQGRRMCVVVRFRDRRSARPFLVANTHLDNRSAAARTFGARLIADRVVKAAKGEGIPLLLAGDFNARPAEESVQVLRTVLEDASSVSLSAHEGPQHTFRGWGRDVPHATIDYVFVTPDVKVLRHATLTDRYDGTFPSDHCPLLATVAFRPFDHQQTERHKK